MICQLVSRVISLGLGTLYPAYRSYKAVRTKNVKEYVKWMMYWVVFALFTTAETFTDVFLAFWFPFYFEIKIVMLVWLLSPTTNGSSILYRKFVHPYLMKKEDKIDRIIEEAQQQSYNTVKEMGGKALRYTSSIIMESVMKAPNVMADLLNNGQMALEHGERSEQYTSTAQHGAGCGVQGSEGDLRVRRTNQGDSGERRTGEVEGGVADSADSTDAAASAQVMSRHNLDIDMSDTEEGDLLQDRNAQAATQEQGDDIVSDEFDLEGSQALSRRRVRQAEAFIFSSGDEMDQDPYTEPQPKKGRKGAKKKTVSTSKKTTRQSKKSQSDNVPEV